MAFVKAARLFAFFYSLLLATFFQSAAASDYEMCKQQSDRVFKQCMAGQSDPSNCQYKTICEDLCIQGKRTCRVFDCRGVIFSEYQTNCVNPPPVYTCIPCYLNDEQWDSYYQTYKYRHCYKVYDQTQGQQILIDLKCSNFDYDRAFSERRCRTQFDADLRCIKK